MVVVTSARSPLCLITGDEEFLVSRAVDAAVEEARARDSGIEVRELLGSTATPGDVIELLSPSLFGGGRVVVLRDAQDAKKELAAAVLAYAADPDPEVVLVATHAGGAKGKALADGLKAAGASVVTAMKITRHRERVDFVRAEFQRLGARGAEDAAEALIAAVGTDLRELSSAAAQLTADTDGKVSAAVVSRYYRGRAEVSGFAVADAAIVGDVPA